MLTILDLVGFSWLLIWNILVVVFLSKIVYRRFNIYVSRKFVHIFAGGLSLIQIPFFFSQIYLPTLICALMTLLTAYTHLKKKELWFQLRGNYADIYFCLIFTIFLPLFWGIDRNAVLASLLFMAWGDAATGIVRNKVYGRRVKGKLGSIAMLITCIAIGFYFKGFVGIGGAAIATISELQEKVDDNLAVPICSMLYFLLINLFLG